MPGRIPRWLCLQAMGSMIRYPNQMSFDIMENGGMLPPPQGVLLVEIVRLDKIVGGGHIFKVCPGCGQASLCELGTAVRVPGSPAGGRSCTWTTWRGVAPSSRLLPAVQLPGVAWIQHHRLGLRLGLGLQIMGLRV